MKLKTLKDFNIDSVGTNTIEEVRQEAIKWYKALKKSERAYPLNAKNGADGFVTPSKYSDEDIVDGLGWIKHFFNIEEKDLNTSRPSE